MNEIQRPTNPIYGRSIGDFVFQTLFPLVLLLLLTLSVGAQGDCTMSWSQENYIGTNPWNTFECVTTIHATDILTTPESCMGEKTVTLFSLDDLSTPIDMDLSLPGAQIDESYIGQRLHCEIVHMATGEKAICYVTIEDYTEPELECEHVAITCFQDIKPISEGGDVEDIEINDCSDYTKSYADNYTYYLCDDPISGFMIAMIERTWTAIDVHGNEATCIQEIYIYRVGIGNGTIAAPGDVYVECSADPSELLPGTTGYPTIEVSTDIYELIPNDLGMCDLEVEYFDNIADGYCEGQTLIIRTWSIKDLCHAVEYNVNPVALVQKIHIVDTTPPTIEGLGSLTVGTNNQTCSANITFPVAIVADLCSDVSVSIHTLFGDLEMNGGTLYNIPVGHHLATYEAVDDCGNINQKLIWIDVIDDDAPNVVCDQFTVVPLNADGLAQVQATSFDDGSTDNCEIASYKVARMATDCIPEDGTFDDFVDFSCCDLGGSVMVAMKVTDEAGNFNICMIEVTVQDKIAPSILCPPHKELDCTEDYTNTAFTGTATAYDACGIKEIRYEDVEVDLNECGRGTVTRKWIAEDNGGLISECYQYLTITNKNPFKESDITWPDDYSATTCGADIDPDNLPDPFGRPMYSAPNCDNIQSYYIDQPYGEYGGAACYEIHRKWTVVDLCVHDPNEEMSGGVWHYIQKIHIDDTTDPIFTKGHENIEVEVGGDCRDIPYTIMAEVDDCSPNLTFFYEVDLGQDGSIDYSGSTQMAELLFSDGTHKVSWRVADGCGNEATAEQLIYFNDTKAPVVNLKSIFVSLMPMDGGGMIEINAKDYNNSSSDNCTPVNWLRYSYSDDPMDNFKTFTCADIGQNVLDIYVHDNEGNFALATTFVDIQDPNGNCPEVMASVTGLVSTQTGKSISNVEIKIEGSGLESLMTNENGSYNIASLPGGSFMLKPSKDVEVMNGVSTYDMVLMQRHILGLVEISDPYTMIAADVNDSGSISTSDMVAMRRLILNVNEDFGSTQSWRFIHTDHQFDGNDVFGAAFPEAYPLNNPTGNMQVDFIGIKIGDINTSASTTDLLGGIEVEGEPLAFEVQDQILEAGKSYEVAFRARDFENVIGFQYTLAFDELSIQVEEINSGALEMEPHNHNMNEIDYGVIATNWFNALPVSIEDEAVLFSIHLSAKETVNLSDVLNIGSEKTASEAYRQATISSPMETGITMIQFLEKEINVEGFELAQNAPNPFGSSTMIEIAIPFDIEGSLSVYDVTGKLVKEWSKDFTQGIHQIEISKNDLGSEGVYYYRFLAGEFTATRKMILID